MELAEASVEKERATTSSKRKRLRNMMDPPRTNSISMTIVFNKLHGGEDAVLKCNRDANRRTSLCSLLQAFAGSGYLEGEKSCRCPGAVRKSIGASNDC